MKIIAEGRLPEAKAYRATCKKCSTIFEFFQMEAKYVSDPRCGHFLQIRCPLTGCNEQVKVGIKKGD